MISRWENHALWDEPDVVWPDELARLCACCERGFTEWGLPHEDPRREARNRCMSFVGEMSPELKLEDGYYVKCGYGSRLDAQLYRIEDPSFMRVNATSLCDDCIRRAATLGQIVRVEGRFL